MGYPAPPPNNALVLTLPASGQGRGVGGLRSGACAFGAAPCACRGLVPELRSGTAPPHLCVGGLTRQRSTAPAVRWLEISDERPRPRFASHHEASGWWQREWPSKAAHQSGEQLQSEHRQDRVARIQTARGFRSRTSEQGRSSTQRSSIVGLSRTGLGATVDARLVGPVQRPQEKQYEREFRDDGHHQRGSRRNPT